MAKKAEIEVVADFSIGIARLRSDLHSVDYALRNRRTGEAGIPMNCIQEWYGYEFTGKSTLTRYLAAKMNPTGHTIIMNVDEAVPDIDYEKHIASLAGFHGTIEFINHLDSKKKPRKHTEMFDEVLDRFPDVDVAILDSIGAFQGDLETEDGITSGYSEAKRATNFARAVREIMNVMRMSDTNKMFLFVNHQHQAMGGRGHTTPGGQAIKNAAAVRARFWRKKIHTDDKDHILGYMAEGQVEKNRYGGGGDLFRLFFLEGRGLHLGMTAVYDCEYFGLAELGTTVKLNGESHGYINATLLKAALEGDDAPFEPFIKALDEHVYGKETESGKDQS